MSNGIYHSIEPVQHDARFYDLVNRALLHNHTPGLRAIALKWAKRLRIRVLEWSGNREKPYFVAEIANALNED